MKRVFYAFLTVFFVSSLQIANAQVGGPPFSSYQQGTFDTVNLSNLNVTFSVPVYQKAGRGLPFDLSLNYMGSIWSATGATGAKTWVPAKNWGWLADTEAEIGSFYSES